MAIIKSTSGEYKNTKTGATGSSRESIGASAKGSTSSTKDPLLNQPGVSQVNYGAGGEAVSTLSRGERKSDLNASEIGTPAMTPEADLATRQGIQKDVNRIAGDLGVSLNKTSTGDFTATPVSPFKTGFEQATQSGAVAPTTSGQARGAVQQYMPQETQETPSFMGGIMETDSNFDSILTGYDDFFSPPKQKDSLVQEYKKMLKSTGVAEINEELIDAKRIIEGTEDDIRNEVTATGGFATESQVQALSNARNKTLIKNYNALLDTRDNAMTQLNTMMDLSIQDRQNAEKEFDRKLDFAFKVQEFKQKATDNARSSLKWAIENGAGSEVLKSPYETSIVEKTLGLPAGGLSGIVAKQNASNKAKFGFTEVGGVLYRTDPTTGEATPVVGGTASVGEKATAMAKSNIDTLDVLVKSPAINSVVGPSAFSRAAGTTGGVLGRFAAGALGGATAGAAGGALFGGIGAFPGAIAGGLIGGTTLALQGTGDKLTGERSNLIAGIEQVRSQLTLDELVNAKARGATFGALSEGELGLLASSGSKLSTWAKTDKDGNVIGYNTTEVNIRKELDKINNFQKLDYLLKGGSPDTVGVFTTPDGHYDVQNSDGSITRLR